MFLSLLVTILFALSGVGIASFVFKKQQFVVRVWLGLVVGLFAMTWLPSLFAFLIGFNLTAQLLGLSVAMLAGGYCFFRTKGGLAGLRNIQTSVPAILTLFLIFIVGAHLFSTHVLYPFDGGYWVGQTTYGDLAMHLGFITGIANQGTFPPHYNIFPHHPVNYPFLCETSSSTLLLFGSSLRAAYLIPALYAYILVILGVYLFFEQWLKRKGRATFATLLFFVGSGFGFAYFFDLLGGNSPAIGKLLEDVTQPNSFAFILDGFYRTPTNLPTVGLRWVNPIVDMLIPQRATLFGWAFLFPCLYLLHGFVFKKEKQNVLPLAILAAGLPLIHTHSFLALGIVSGTYFICELLTNFDKKRLMQWGLYAGIAILLAAPQLFGFSFSQVAESGMVKLHFNWANELDSFLWFYIKNLGWIFILLPFAWLLLSKRDRKIVMGALVIWLIAECVTFQPNAYDNNKLLFVWFAYLCGLAAKLLGYLYHRARYAIHKRVSVLAIQHSLNAASMAVGNFLLCFFFFKLVRPVSAGIFAMQIGTLLTIIVLFAFLLVLQCSSLWVGLKKRELFSGWVQSGLALGLAGLVFVLLHTFYRQYNAAVVTLPLTVALVFLFFLVIFLIAMLYQRSAEKKAKSARDKVYAGQYVALQLVAFVMCITLFLGGVLTIARERRGKYQYFGSAQIEAADFVRENTSPDAMFLTDYSWHINPVPVLTGRNIVCGSDLFLFFHGVDTNIRHEHVRAMLEYPAANSTLFNQYDVDYVYIGSPERSNYECDFSYFDSHFEIVFQNDDAVIYKIQ